MKPGDAPKLNVASSLFQMSSGAGVAAITAARSFWRRVYEIDGRYATLAYENVLRALKNVPEPDDMMLGVDAFMRRYAVEIGMTPGLAAERFVRAMSGWDEPAGQTHTVDGRTVLLPARVLDASQGFGVYSVPYDKARALVPDAFKPLSLGGRRAVAALFIVDYRESDLGAYFEVGLSVYVTPTDTSAGLGRMIPGTFTHTLIVNDRFSRDAGREIWGYPKTVNEIDIRYTDTTAVCTLGPSSAPVLSVSFARGGKSSTTNIPVYTYTERKNDPTLTLFTRTGRGERTRFGGDGVKIDYSSDESLAGLLKSLEIPHRPILWSWTDRMQGTFGVPHSL